MEETLQNLKKLAASPQRWLSENLEVERALEKKYSCVDMKAAVSRHPKLTNGMRRILVEWLYQTVEYFDNGRTTFWLTVTLLDTFLSVVKNEVLADKFQMLGSIVYWIASKNENGYDAPTVEDIIQLLGELSDKDTTTARVDIFGGECMVLNVLSFNVLTPSPAILLDHYFLRCCRRDSDTLVSRDTHHALCCFLLDITAMEVRFNEFSPSERASGAVYLSRVMIGKKPWDEIFANTVKVPVDCVKKCSDAILQVLMREKTSPSYIHRKFNRTGCYRVAALALKFANCYWTKRANKKRCAGFGSPEPPKKRLTPTGKENSEDMKTPQDTEDSSSRQENALFNTQADYSLAGNAGSSFFAAHPAGRVRMEEEVIKDEMKLKSGRNWSICG